MAIFAQTAPKAATIVMEQTLTLRYRHFASLDMLDEADARLVAKARQALACAYAPYSHYRVGAAARLASGRIVTAGNQESPVFPAGLCAERVLLFRHMAEAPDDPIVTLAVTSESPDRVCTPCGGCRQVMADVIGRQGRPFRLIMSNARDAILVEDASVLLPFAFSLD